MKHLLSTLGYLLALSYAATSHAAPIVFDADTITAVPLAHFDGDPLDGALPGESTIAPLDWVCGPWTELHQGSGLGRSCEWVSQ